MKRQRPLCEKCGWGTGWTQAIRRWHARKRLLCAACVYRYEAAR